MSHVRIHRLVSMAVVCVFVFSVSSVALAQWSDEFEDYDPDTGVSGQGDWEGWNRDPGVDADVTDEEAFSAPNSLLLRSNTDVVVVYRDYAEGLWTYRAMVFIPSNHTGETWFILLNRYEHGGPKNWSTQVTFENGQVRSRGGSGFGGSGTTAVIPDDWVELKVEIDLDANTQAITYDGQFLDETPWQVSGLNEIQAVDLFSNGGSSAYYDDLSLEEQETGAVREVIVGGECPDPDPVSVTVSDPVGGADPA